MKQFYVIHYWYYKNIPPFEKDIFYGTIEDAEYLVHTMMVISPYKIEYAEIEELGNCDSYMRIDRPKDLEWNWEK